LLSIGNNTCFVDVVFVEIAEAERFFGLLGFGDCFFDTGLSLFDVVETFFFGDNRAERRGGIMFCFAKPFNNSIGSTRDLTQQMK
jgi:hypothetical protein